MATSSRCRRRCRRRANCPPRCPCPSASARSKRGRSVMEGNGYLAIWSDLAPEDETDWMHWITREHAAERVGVEGFLACRIFRALGAAVNRYFILYELEDEHV